MLAEQMCASRSVEADYIACAPDARFSLNNTVYRSPIKKTKAYFAYFGTSNHSSCPDASAYLPARSSMSAGGR
jgi:hypothetical protein